MRIYINFQHSYIISLSLMQIVRWLYLINFETFFNLIRFDILYCNHLVWILRSYLSSLASLDNSRYIFFYFNPSLVFSLHNFFVRISWFKMNFVQCLWFVDDFIFILFLRNLSPIEYLICENIFILSMLNFKIYFLFNSCFIV